MILKGVERLLYISDEVVGALDSAGKSYQVGGYARGFKLAVVHLAVSGARGVETAGAGIGNMGLDRAELETAHELLGGFSSALDAEAYYAAGTVREIFFCERVVGIVLEIGIKDPADSGIAQKIICDGAGISAVALHSHMEALEAQIEDIGALGRRSRAEVAHELGGGLGYIGALFAEALGICNAVVAVVGSREPREFIGMGKPVKTARIDYRAADGRAVAVHVLGGGMGDDVCPEFKRAAVYRRRKGVVDYQRDTVAVGGIGKTFDVKNTKRGVRDGLAENGLGVRAESSFKLGIGAVGGDKGEIDAHFLHRDRKKIEGSAVNRRLGNDMVAAGRDVEYREEIGGLTRRGEHRSGAAL